MSMNRKYKDALFRIIFSRKADLLSLYNALAGTHYTDESLLEINTLKDVLCIGIKNDISFIIDNYQCLYEHQSTRNPNMPLRGLYYFADLYKTRYSGDMLYHEKRIKLLTPKYIVFYNGEDRMPDRIDMKLSDSFIHKEENTDLEVVAHLININPGHNEDLYSKCQILWEYVQFVARMSGALRECKPRKRKQVVMAVIDSCIEDGILADILSAERARIMASVLAGFNKKAYTRVIKSEAYEDGYDAGVDFGIQQGIHQGLQQGLQQSLQSTITRMIANHCTNDEIITYTGCTQETIDEVRSKYTN